MQREPVLDLPEGRVVDAPQALVVLDDLFGSVAAGRRSKIISARLTIGIRAIQYSIMKVLEKVLAVLAGAEAKLRQLVGEAAAGGAYDSAVRIATLAKALAAMAADLDKGGEAGPSTTDPAACGAGHPEVECLGNPSASASARQAGYSRPADTGRSRRAPQKGEYPKFARQGDQLVKVSWSKKQRAEYQHKAPRRVAELLAAAIARRTGNGRLFTSEDIFPLKDPGDGSEVPSYQAYAALAWFKATGMVKAHGRRGYTAKNQGKLPEVVTEAWQQLPELPA